MSRGRRLALAVLAAAATACGDVGPTPPDRPNVLLVSIDSLRADHLGCYGYARDTSPTIDRLAREGVRFETAVAPTSWTLPSHATLFTALPPEGHGLRADARALADDAVTLAEVLGASGYATAAFVAGPFLRRIYGFGQGFDVYDESAVRSFRDAQRGVTSPQLVDALTRWLDESGARDERPFFAFLHLWDVHYDYAPPPPYDRMFDPDYTGPVDGHDFELGTAVHRDMDPRDLHHVIALYDGEIRYTDEHLGALLDTLHARGELDDTLVVVTADHGDAFFEHGRKGHRKDLYDETLLVPLVLRHPRTLPAGRVVDAQVRLMDVPTTILSICGVEPPTGFGFDAEEPGFAPADLTRWIDAREPPPELIAFGDLEARWASARRDDVKLVMRRTAVLRDEFYDLAEDPGERERLDDDPRASALLDAVAAWKRRWARRPPPSVAIELDDEQWETLRALGYVK